MLDFESTSGIRNVSGVSKYGCYAYLPGTGPSSRSCRDCFFARNKSGERAPDNKNAWCVKYSEMKGRKGSSIAQNSRSCKYFQKDT